MNKKEFLNNLRKKLSHLPKDEVEERINFYSEMIDDQLEEGIPEEEIISSINLKEEFNFNESSKESNNNDFITKAKNSIAKNILIILGSPVWFPILLALVITLFAVIFSFVISFWTSFISLVAVSFAGFIYGVVLLLSYKIATGLAIVGVSLVVAGLSIFAFYISKFTTKYSILLCKKTFTYFKKKKEEQ